MFKNIVKKPWICAGCISRRNYAQIRLLSTVATARTDEPLPITVSRSAPGAIHDDKTLRNIFDSEIFWKEFSQSSRANSTGDSNGLFRIRYLTNPKGFETYADVNLRKAKGIVEKVLQASSVEEYKRIAKDFDRLSDLLCRVIDVSDFVRSTHPDHRMQAAASRTHAKMFEYMNVLNTMTRLNEQLGIAMANQDVMSSWTEEEKAAAKSLKQDFAKSAISLPKAVRERFVSLSQEISELGHTFVEEMAPARQTITVPSSKLKGLDPMLVKSFSSWGQATLPVVGDSSVAALRSVQDEDTRKGIFVASKTASRDQVILLENLLRKRAELASLTGYETYSALTLGDKMAKSPQSVSQFLQAALGENKPRVQQEMAELLKLKMKDPNGSTPILQPWDKDFYISQVTNSMRSTSRNVDFLSSYFSLGTVMQGLSRLFTRLYGIRFVPRETLPGETWNEDVRRLDVISETEGHVAVLYCDLFSRPGKSPNPAHFTLRCSREITDDELEEARSSPSELFSSPEEDANDGMATSRASGVLKQLPTIALICDFLNFPRPSLLTFGEVQTLFHEMGHAIHSILSRTALHEVSGTRCATDFAELPSVLMEYFAADPAVLSLFARHYKTDQPLPYEVIAEKLALDKRFAGSDAEQQIILAMVDQAYHSSLPLSPSFNSTEILHQMQRTHGSLPPDPPGTCWQGFFGHLVGYGSTYYSYLFDQVLAARIWQVVFKSGRDSASIDRVNGERMKEKVLRWGGGRDPWLCVAEVLDDGRVEDGNERAMAVVGSWLGAREKGR